MPRSGLPAQRLPKQGAVVQGPVGGQDDADQLRDQLFASIVDGALDTGHRFDEHSLMRRWRVPRVLVRRALSSLADAGVVRRAPRVGTSPTNGLIYFLESDGALMSAPGDVELRYVTVSLGLVPAPEGVAQDLRLEPGTPVTRIRRVSRANGVTIGRWTIWTALELPQSYRDEGLPPTLNWYQVAGELTGDRAFTLRRRHVVFQAAAEDAALLDVRPGDPLKFVSRRTYRASGAAVDRSWGRLDARRLTSDEIVNVRL